MADTIEPLSPSRRARVAGPTMRVSFSQPPTPPKRIAVVGVGGVGGYFGARLASRPPSEVELWLVGRRASLHTEALRTRGLTVYSVAGDMHIEPDKLNIASDPQEVGACDYVLICLKTFDLERMTPTLLSLCKPDGTTAFVPLSNGISAPDMLRSALKERAHVLGGLCGLTSSVEEPGVVRHTSGVEPGVLVFGELDGSCSPAEEWLRECFIRTGVPATKPNPGVGVLGHMWKKLVIISTFGGAGAITRQGIGYILSEPRTASLYKRLAEEGVAVARAYGHGKLVEGDWVVSTHLKGMATLPKHATSSMQRDIIAGRPSELHEQIGAMVCNAEARDVHVPACSLVYAALLLQENGARERADPAHRAAAIKSLVRTASMASAGESASAGAPASELAESTGETREGRNTNTVRDSAVSLPAVLLSPRDEANAISAASPSKHPHGGGRGALHSAAAGSLERSDDAGATTRRALRAEATAERLLEQLETVRSQLRACERRESAARRATPTAACVGAVVGGVAVATGMLLLLRARR